MLHFLLYLLNAVIHEKQKSLPCALVLYESYGMRFQMLLGNTFVIGDIGLQLKNLLKILKI